MKWLFGLFACFAMLLFVEPLAADDNKSEKRPLTLVVMDPLCDRLACDCVEGYAQRKYEVLAKHLEKKLDRRIRIFWGETLSSALEETKFKPDIIVGKHSVVKHDASENKFDMQPMARLTGKDGSVTQWGLIVVRKKDPAKTVADLKDYRIFFGPEAHEEKHSAPMKLLKKNGIEIPAKLEISGACSQAASKLVELEDDVKAAAIISSYAEPLLAGCGTIDKGELRVIGKSGEVPFVSAFVSKKLDAETRNEIRQAFTSTASDKKLLKAIESSKGFVNFSEKAISQATNESTESKEASVADSNAKRAEALSGGKKN